MKRIRLNPSLLTATAAVAGMALGAGIACAGVPSAHQSITLKTYEEVAKQFGMGTPAAPYGMPIQLDANGKGFPYSPKMTCGTQYDPMDGHVVNVCHNYDAIADHAFHSALGVEEWKDSSDGTFAKTTQTRAKPWTQTGAMWGKW